MSNEEQAARTIAQRLSSLSASVIADITKGDGVIGPGLIRFSGQGAVAGRAVTADCAEGSSQAVFAALEEAKPGAILCMTGPGATAYMGDLLATHIVTHGLLGAVVDACIRDKDVIATLPASFFARGVSPVALRKREPGRAMIPVSIGGVTVNPGDWIVADSDGVVVIAPTEVETVVAKAEVSARMEERIMVRIKAGEKMMDAVRKEVETGS